MSIERGHQQNAHWAPQTLRTADMLREQAIVRLIETLHQVYQKTKGSHHVQKNPVQTTQYKSLQYQSIRSQSEQSGPNQNNQAMSTPMNDNASFLQQVERAAQQRAEQIYLRYPVWNVMQGDKLRWYLDRKSGLRYAPGKRPRDVQTEIQKRYADFEKILSAKPFWEVGTNFTRKDGLLFKGRSSFDKDVTRTLYDSANRRLWVWFDDFNRMEWNQAQARLNQAEREIGLGPWTLPSKDVLLAFRNAADNPARYGSYNRLFDIEYWLCQQGRMDFDYSSPSVAAGAGDVMAYLDLPAAPAEAFWAHLQQQGLKLAHGHSHSLPDIPAPDTAPLERHADQAWKGKDFAGLWAALKAERCTLVAKDAPTVVIDPMVTTQDGLLNLDYTPCRLPKLENAQLTDLNQGLWELWGEDAALLDTLGLRARNPERDVRDEWVAMDFGTSSTVVAVATQNGGKRLLRVGARDYNAPVLPKHYENPTVLEFLDLEAFLSVWNRQVYRPQLDWDWVKAAHEALHNFRSDARNPRKVNSVMLYLKRWVLEAERLEFRLVDQKQGLEYRLSPPKEQHPVRGQAMQAHPDAPLDVIELYAWYLGMAINWRQQGIHLKYAMTFPVKYTQDVRNKMLASFSRGLQRSLPSTLLNSTRMNEFEVREIATEPMAYAVATLPQAGLQPNQEGLAYGVFDFGGGTTDFDFGLWRLPTPEEMDEDGAESVFERLGSGGDPYLGGENLLALLAYQVFQDNLQTAYDKKLIFTRPLSEPAFPGSEAVVDQSALAQANTAMLMHELRPLLERPESFDEENKLQLDMLNRSGEGVSVTLNIDIEALQALIQARVERGAEGFLSEMHAAFETLAPRQIHILLAGNASRGRWVREAFTTEGEAWADKVERSFGLYALEFIVHFAVGAEDACSEAPNCKTAVALGALDLVPGSPFIQKDRQQARSMGDAPFKYFAGPLSNMQLQPVLTPGAAYNEWHEFGIVRDGVFVLAWSASPRARSGMKQGDAELLVKRVSMPGAGKGYRCFGRVVSAGAIELAAAASREAFDAQGPGVTTRSPLDDRE